MIEPAPVWPIMSTTLTALKEALEIIPPDRLEMLADWLDGLDHGCMYYNNATEVQDDLRRMAGAARAALAMAEGRATVGQDQDGKPQQQPSEVVDGYFVERGGEP